MTRRVAQGSLTVLFLVLLATPLVWRYLSARREDARTTVRAEDALRRYGLYLEEVARASGIDFTHQGPSLDPGLDHIMPMIASLGASVSIVDFDRDGWQDLYVTNSGEGSRNALYRNSGGGRFEDVAADMDIGDMNPPGTGVSMGAVWGDYDNDGYEDLFLYKWGRPELFHNERGRGFTRVGAEAGLPPWINANTAIWFDYDRDGYLDLFVGGYYPETINLWTLTTTRIMPESFEYANNGGRNYLFRNRGDGTFEAVGERLGLTSRRWTLAAGAADLRRTGYPDLFVANDYGVDELFLNEGGRHFISAGERAGVGLAPKSGMNAAFGDILNQGALAIYVSNISEPGVLLQGNNLWVPDPSADGLRYRNLAGAMGVELGGWSYGAQFGDLNNDGHLDLFLVNGFVSAGRRASYWYDLSLVVGGHRAIISDAKHWPAMDGRSLSGYERSRVWLNDGAGRFQDVAQVLGVTDLYDGRAVALVDLSNRGVLDIVVANQRGPLLLYRNRVPPENEWIGFELEGTRSNRSAIGTRVEVFWNGVRQVQEVSGGSGFAAQNQRRLHFGLGPNPKVEKAVIRWPSGALQTLAAPATRTVHRIREPS
ncbi:MAG: CRTAC1 family protein [Gemmatimonadetes bacterium]|nr:CRTAC1 family protein [Gemmatimonadota bacterium]